MYLFQQVPTPRTLAHLCRDRSEGQKGERGPGVTFSGNLLTLWETTVCVHLDTISKALVRE